MRVIQGYLELNKNDRYEVDGYELTSGCPLDFYDEDLGDWVGTRLEHDGDDYYIVAYGKGRYISGMLVRVY